jgi:hypothetical protein
MCRDSSRSRNRHDREGSDRQPYAVAQTHT